MLMPGDQLEITSSFLEIVPLSPLSKRDNRCQKVFTFLRRDVFLIRAPVGSRGAFEYVRVHELFESGRENVLCQTEIPLNFAEPSRASEKHMRKDEEGPPVSNGFVCPGKRARRR